MHGGKSEMKCIFHTTRTG